MKLVWYHFFFLLLVLFVRSFVFPFAKICKQVQIDETGSTVLRMRRLECLKMSRKFSTICFNQSYIATVQSSDLIYWLTYFLSMFIIISFETPKCIPLKLPCPGPHLPISNAVWDIGKSNIILSTATQKYSSSGPQAQITTRYLKFLPHKLIDHHHSQFDKGVNIMTTISLHKFTLSQDQQKPLCTLQQSAQRRLPWFTDCIDIATINKGWTLYFSHFSSNHQFTMTLKLNV